MGILVVERYKKHLRVYNNNNNNKNMQLDINPL